MGKYETRYRDQAAGHLLDGEQVLATSRALPDGFRETVWFLLVGFLSLVLGLIVAVAVQQIVLRRWQKAAEHRGFPATQNMALVLTSKRLLVFERRGARLKRFKGDVSLDRVESIQFVPAGRRPELIFHFLNARPVTVEAIKADEPERLATEFAAMRAVAPA